MWGRSNAWCGNDVCALAAGAEFAVDRRLLRGAVGELSDQDINVEPLAAGNLLQAARIGGELTAKLGDEGLVGALQGAAAAGVEQASAGLERQLAGERHVAARGDQVGGCQRSAVLEHVHGALDGAEVERLGGIDLSSADARSADTSVLTALSRPLDEITEDQQARACDELRPYARELAAASGLSISRGLSLSAAMAARRITCIRPSSSWTTTLVATDCIEALATFAPESLSNEILYIAGSVLSASLPPSRLIDAAKHAGSDLVLAFYENITVQRFAQIFETQGVSIYRSASDADRSVNLSASLDRTRQELGLQVYEFD